MRGWPVTVGARLVNGGGRRLQALIAIEDGGMLTTNEVAAILGVTEANAYYHLGRLRAAGCLHRDTTSGHETWWSIRRGVEMLGSDHRDWSDVPPSGGERAAPV